MGLFPPQQAQGEVKNLMENVSICEIHFTLEGNRTAASTWPAWLPISTEQVR